MRARPVGSGPPPKFLLKFLSHAGLISGLFLVVAAVYSYLIVSGQIAEKAKIQENALLAGLVDEGWRDTAKLQHFLRALNGMKTKSALREFILDAFEQMRVEVYRHRFQAVPSSFSRPNSTFGKGENLYAIVRAFRATPVEGILLVVPMRSSHLDAIAVALTFADYARKQIYWARDIVFLFIDGGSKLALEAWLSDYHGQRHPFFFPNPDGELDAHSGTFIGAFGMDFSGSLFDHVQLQFGMVNGKLPNMDLLNLFVLLVEKAGSVPAVHGIQQTRGQFDVRSAVQTFTNGIRAQSFDELQPLTAPFGRFGLNAVTMRGRQAGAGKSTALDLADIVRVVEGGVRSLNNLLEKFHHSYLLYALIHPHRFVSAALYMPLLGMLLAPLLLMALREWLQFGGFSQLGNTGSALYALGGSHLLALAFYTAQSALHTDPRFSARVHIAPFSMLFPPIAMLVVPPLFRFRKMSAASYHFARFAISTELALFLGALGLVHFPLALFLSLLMIPLALAMNIIPNRCNLLLRFLCFLLLSPVLLGRTMIFIKHCTGQPTAATCWQNMTAKFAEIALAHFAHGSWLMALLSGPVVAINLSIGLVMCSTMVDGEKSKEEEDINKIEQKQKEGKVD